MFNSARPDDSLLNSPLDSGNTFQDVSSLGAQSPVEKSNNNSWQTVHFPGTVTVDQISGITPNLQTNAMDSSGTSHSNTHLDNSSTFEPAITDCTNQREAELLNLVRDLNECNDVLLAKVSQLEESLERSQAALQAEVDRTPGDRIGNREIVQLVTELEQSNQTLQHHQILNESLQTELTASQERATQLEADHKSLLRQSTQQSQELLQANANCRDLRARLQRQQRYTLQFKAALEKCLSMSTEGQSSSTPSAFDASGLAMPKSDEIRPWASTLGYGRLGTQLESMIRGTQSSEQSNPQHTDVILETEAEDQLWHDLARVMDSDETVSEHQIEEDISTEVEEVPPSFTEPSPWHNNESTSLAASTPDGEDTSTSSQFSPQANEILERVKSARAKAAADTYLPAMSAQGSPSPLVNPLKPQKRISSLSAIDLPNFPRLKKQTPQAKA